MYNTHLSDPDPDPDPDWSIELAGQVSPPMWPSGSRASVTVTGKGEDALQ